MRSGHDDADPSGGSRVMLSRDELFAPAVDEALTAVRAVRRRVEPEVREVSAVRRVLLSSFVYYPLAGVIAAIVAWSLLDRFMIDAAIVGGKIEHIDEAPMPWGEGFLRITVAATDVITMLDGTSLEVGAAGEPPYPSLDAVEEGDFVEIAVAREVAGPLFAVAVRPSNATSARTHHTGEREDNVVGIALYFPATAAIVTLFLLVAEGLSARNWVRLLSRTFLGTLLSAVFCLLAFIPAGTSMAVGIGAANALDDSGRSTVHTVAPLAFVALVAGRSVAWCFLGAGLGFGMNLARSTAGERANSVVGGTLGGALGGLFFDPIARFFQADSSFADASTSRLVGILAVGLCIGIFVALVEQLSKDAWIRVRTGPLAGKAFILYRTPTILGSSPSADVYLFKDAEIADTHAAIHRVGGAYEIEHVGKRGETIVGGQTIRRRRLVSGDTIVLGGTVIQFEERERKAAVGRASVTEVTQ